VAVGSASAVVNVGLGVSGDITTNMKEMLTDHSKKIISVGLPEGIDTDANIILGQDLEDPVFVNSNGLEITATEAIAESE
jgi:NAD(P)H-hydrate repair Nnr-like enzyme with NAD(P)H-hydrate epimerase domain